MFKVSFLSFLLTIFCCTVIAQPKAPQVTPPNPEVYSFTKYGDLPVGMLTGTFQYSIPLYKVVSGKLSHDITLSYSSNGVKVDEISSREGLGWTLNVGGSITRSIMGKLDELSDRMLWPWMQYNGCDTCWNFWVYIRSMALNQYADPQPDEFFYKVDNYSGKFIYDRSGTWKQLRSNGIKINGDMTSFLNEGFTLLNTDGTMYYFQLSEFSRQYGLSDESYPDWIRNTWHLKKIVAATGDSIVFNYSAAIQSPSTENVKYYTGISQSYSTVLSAFPSSSFYSYIGPSGNTASGNGCTDVPPLSTKIQVNETNPSLLTSINFKGGVVHFFYSDRLDQPLEKKLDSIKVIRSEDGQLIRLINLHHSYSESQGSVYDSYVNQGSVQGQYPYLKKRLFLDSLRESSVSRNQFLVHRFQYDSANWMPPRLSFSQDKYGYFNGKINSYLFPKDTWIDILMDGTHIGGDRSYSFSSAKKGVLKTIHYPTGGYTAIEYEPNRLHNQGQFRINYDTLYAGFNPSIVEKETVQTDTFHKDSRLLRFKVTCNWAADPPDFFPDLYYVSYSFINVNTNQCVYKCEMPVNPGAQYWETALNWNLPSGVYRVELTASQPGLIANLYLERQSIIWDTAFNSNGIGGIRVKSIATYPGYYASAPVLRKEYVYGKWTDQHGASGVGINDFDYSYVTASRKIGAATNLPGGPAYCGFNSIQSNTAFPIYSFDQSAVLYPTVLELNEQGGKNNGGTEYNYFIEELATNQLARPMSYVNPEYIWDFSPITVTGAPYTNYDFRTGLMKGIKRFTYQHRNSNRVILEETENYYSVDSSILSKDSFYVVNTVINRPATWNNHYTTRWFSDFDINKYYRFFSWSRLDSVRTKHYPSSGDTLSQLTRASMEYSSLNFQIKKEKTYTSAGDTVETTTTYPVDYGGYPYSSMVSGNFIDYPIDVVSRQNGNIVKRVFSEYVLSGNTFLPYRVSSSLLNNVLAEDVVFQAYDVSGNITQYKAKDGIVNSFIWDYDNRYPVAKVAGAPIQDVAYTSFETTNKGGWSFNGAPAVYATVPGGNRAYNLQAGAMSKAVNSSSKYVVSYWIQGSNPLSIPGTQQSYPVSGKTRFGWKYFEHVVTGVSTVTLSGSGLVDEVRIHPYNAVMTTYCYNPLIGVTCILANNGDGQFYEYDDFNRLKIVRNTEGQVLKRMCYNVFGQPENCQ